MNQWFFLLARFRQKEKLKIKILKIIFFWGRFQSLKVREKRKNDQIFVVDFQCVPMDIEG
jgi:hypothetical protein